MNKYFRLLFISFVLLFPLALPILAQDTEERWWGYCGDDDALAGFSTGQREDFSCAIFVPGDRGVGMNKSFQRVRLALQGCTSVRNLKVWLSKSLPSEAESATEMCIDVDAEQMIDATFFEVELPRVYTIRTGGIYVGYSFETDAQASGKGKKAVLSTTGVESLPNGFFLKSSKTYKEWRDLQPYNRGNLALQLLLCGNFLNDAVSIDSFDEVVTLPNQAVQLPLSLRNRGVNGVNSLTYTLWREDEVVAHAVWQPSIPVNEVAQTFSFNLEMMSADEASLTAYTISIDSVNGQPNELVADAVKTGGIVTLESSLPHNVLMEEVTGTWCMWCPRGAVAIEHLLADYPDSFVGIAIHGNDIMEIPTYYVVKEQISGLPGCLLDRSVNCDPFEGTSGTSYGIHNDVERLMETLCPASIEVEAKWTDADSSRIDLRTEVTLGYDRQDAPPYGIAYVLLADSLCGQSGDWAQRNGFSGSSFTDYSSDPYLSPLTEYPSYIVGYKYNDVAIAAFGVNQGLEGSVEGPFARGVANCHSYQISIDGNDLVQDKNRLKVVAILLDRQTGKVVNCHCTAVGNGTPEQSGIDRIHTDRNQPRRRYTPDGRLCTPSYRGLTIEGRF